MTKISDDCCSCTWKDRLKKILDRAQRCIVAVRSTRDIMYYPDGEGIITLPLGNGGEVYLPGEGIDIDGLTISARVDGKTVKIVDGKLTSTATAGKTYYAGNAIVISSAGYISVLPDEKTIDIIDDKLTVIGGTGGKTYVAGDGIAISADDVISAAVDGETVKLVDGKLTATGTGGKIYTAGGGITIDNDIISVAVDGKTVKVVDGKLAATGTGGKIYTAGDGITISADDVISADIPTVSDTETGLVTPEMKKKWDSAGAGGSDEWAELTGLADIDTTKVRIGTTIIGTELTGTTQAYGTAFLQTFTATVTSLVRNGDGDITRLIVNCHGFFKYNQVINLLASMEINLSESVTWPLTVSYFTTRDPLTEYSKAALKSPKFKNGYIRY